MGLDGLLQPLAKVPEFAHTLSFYPTGVKIELIFVLWAAVSEIQAELFKTAIFGHETWSLPKIQEVAHILYL